MALLNWEALKAQLLTGKEKLKTNRGRGELVVMAASYYAGAHYGPQAKAAVENYGPSVVAFVAKLLG